MFLVYEQIFGNQPFLNLILGYIVSIEPSKQKHEDGSLTITLFSLMDPTEHLHKLTLHFLPIPQSIQPSQLHLKLLIQAPDILREPSLAQTILLIGQHLAILKMLLVLHFLKSNLLLPLLHFLSFFQCSCLLAWMLYGFYLLVEETGFAVWGELDCGEVCAVAEE